MTVQAVGDAFNNGFYEEQIKLRSLPLLDSKPQRSMRTLAAKDAISTRKVQYFFSMLKKVFEHVSYVETYQFFLP
jgi:chloride channel 7